jgi:putative sterol carrier protein
VRVRDGEEGERVEVRQGSVPDPDLVVTGEAETFLAVASGRLSPEEAVQSGALKVSRSVSSRSVEEKFSRVFLAPGGSW